MSADFNTYISGMFGASIRFWSLAMYRFTESPATRFVGSERPPTQAVWSPLRNSSKSE
ncbi:MAG TPA: hypothetical protein VK453_00785 [Micromonosporaceae bacterium]|nr:hypothetical protein [Micromonosporaceae bacterium]